MSRSRRTFRMNFEGARKVQLETCDSCGFSFGRSECRLALEGVGESPYFGTFHEQCFNELAERYDLVVVGRQVYKRRS